MLQIASSVVPLACLRFLGDFLSFLLIFEARFTAVPRLAFFVAALLLLDVDAAILVEVVQQ